MNFRGAHILTVNQFQRDDVELVFQVADNMEPIAHRLRVTKALDGAILGNMFFEPSTRTRMSFGCAFNLLGGHVRETTGMESSSITKGESLYDTARLSRLQRRHCDAPPGAGSVAEFARASRVRSSMAAMAPMNTRHKLCWICIPSRKNFRRTALPLMACALPWSEISNTVVQSIPSPNFLRCTKRFT